MTTPKKPSFHLPPTVRDYLSDAAIRTGVDALLGVKDKSLPPSLLHEELADYYAARGAAELVRFDWATALLALWNATWGSVLEPAWKPAALETLVKEGFAVTPTACWDEDAICFYHEIGTHFLATAVSFDQSETVIAFWYQKGKGKPLASFEGFAAKQQDEWDDEWLLHRSPVSPAGEKFSVAKLRTAAQSAAAEANRLAGIK